MAHLIDETNGAAFFSVGKPAWHGLGIVLPESPEYDEILKTAKIDYNVAIAPNVHRFPDGKEMLSPESFFTYREDVNRVLAAHVGKRYEVIQNAQALAVAETLLESDLLVCETAGAIRHGAISFMTFKVKKPMNVDGDIVEQYLVIMNSFDGSTPIMVFFTNIRVVCNNTLQMAINGAISKFTVRHTLNAQNRLDEAKRILEQSQANAECFTEAAKAMKRQRWDKSQFFDYLAALYCTPAESKAMQAGKHPLEVLSARKRNTLQDVIQFAETGIGQDLAGENTAWWAYNAITGYISHKQEKDAEKRFSKLLGGTDDAFMTKALHLAAKPDFRHLNVAALN